MLKSVILLAFALAALLSRAAAGEAVAPAPLSPAEAQRALDVVQDPVKRSQLIETLQAIAKATPAPEKPALEPGSLGAQLLGQSTGLGARLAAEASATAKSLADLPLLRRAAARIFDDPAQRDILAGVAWRLALALVAALLIEFLTKLAVRRPLRVLETYAPPAARDDPPEPDASDVVPPPSVRFSAGAGRSLQRLPFALARLIIDLLAPILFAATGTVLAGIVARTASERLFIVTLVDAYAIWRAVLCIGRMAAAPDTPALRLLPITDDTARYLMHRLAWIASVAIFGNALAECAALAGVDEAAKATLVRLVALIVAALLAMVVVECRHIVVRHLQATGPAEGGAARWRNWFAASWHYLAIILIAFGWIVWAAGARNGAAGLRILIGTAAVLLVSRLAAIIALGSLDRVLRLGRAPTRETLAERSARVARYYRPARLVIIALIGVLTAIAVLQVWGADAIGWFESGGVGGRLVSALVTIMIAVGIAIVIWEGATAALNRHLQRLDANEQTGRSARFRTLLPLLHTALVTVILVVVGLTALSEIGVNIAPLLAGAGIVGVAIGFGSQKLVQDVITGMFVLMENAIQIGDQVTVAGLSGAVEQLSVRNIWLRDPDGSVHIVPFSAVSTITNASRGAGNAVISVTIEYAQDIDKVTDTLRAIAAEMREDPAYGRMMLSDFQRWGVDSVGASGVTISGQIVCTDAGRRPVSREFNRRLKQRFDQLGIKLA